ncbi:helix-turn-helix domain-containing protein [Acidovorax sp. PRC11]|uniref:helix-turn-helix domain-containing protein n=1 Tax=Acidovorax sp. PRC11 TaxID=2962592 RepID=UPI00288109F1|nr:helix-turn-helix domain-containing protein [Acidovorax sp. PRC11]MDT0138122.1 XRE family transcriptional regulator [Acidovorax sp. PRC11]
MSTTLQSIIEEFSAQDQKLIQCKASVLAEEMVRHADSLAEVRSALMKTQDEVARVLNVKQNAVAQLEKRSDLLLSTLRKYVEAMGGELAVAVRTGAGTVIMLDSLSSLAKPSAPHRARASGVARKSAARPASKSKRKGKHEGTAVA